ncbi:hypothetical protein IscW_ISCW018977 [Ixodes scapularis]|uniref:Uncharacterized protein n=1 Tax=Ixodes scapularis TaxID=6945 RepID=B7PMA6_IXOSC|nr:hypothetical protein IscW_ISCW018977 [Ixodes scapularis]|eukprot:XP_002434904.1 hypothetical protein IscW_ISCW018977 [Ixodes scapularis]
MRMMKQIITLASTLGMNNSTRSREQKDSREKDRKRNKMHTNTWTTGDIFSPSRPPNHHAPKRDNRCMAQTSTFCSTGRAHALYCHALHPKTSSRKPSNNKRFTQSRPNNG